MRAKKAFGKCYGMSLSKAEQRAMENEINKQIAESTRKHFLELDAIILWFLHEEFGFGKKRLRRVYDGLAVAVEELCSRYEMNNSGDDVYLCIRKLKEAGIDIEQWKEGVN